MADSAALGLIAGRGSLPLDIARSARRRGRPVAAVAFHELADRRLEGEVSQLTWLHPGQLGAAIEALRAGGAQEAVMAGNVAKLNLYADPASLRKSSKPAARSLFLTMSRCSTRHSVKLPGLKWHVAWHTR